MPVTMKKVARFLLWTVILSALATPAFAETRTISWDPVTTYTDSTPIEPGKTVTYSAYWTTDPGLSLASLHTLGTSIATTSTTFDPDAQLMTRGGTVYFTAKAVLNTGEESALSPAFAWVVPIVATPGALSVTAGGLTSSGTTGGPFTPSSVSYTLTNTGGTSINWTASKTQTWVTLSSASGTLAAGGTATVTVTINSGANGLAAGGYSDTVTLTNTTNGTGNTTRAVGLTVSAAAGALSVTAGGLTSSGTTGGPFTPSSVSYTLTNTGGTSINWTASKTQTWVTLSSASGTLAAGGTATVTVTINSGANGLAAGGYSDTVTLTNTTNGTGNTTRAVGLTVSAAAGALSVTAGGLTSSGTAGGPFTPSSVSYTLTNTGGTSINWTASKTQTWVTLSSASGTLAAGGTATVTVTINSGANSLAAGGYSDTVTLTNTTNGTGNTTRAVGLTVSAAAGALSVTAGGLTSSGTTGGPFTPSSVSYTLTNTGGTSINWTASKTQTWVTLSSASGTLAAGGTATVTVTINSGANSLAAGGYSDTVTLTNTTNGTGNTTRAVGLTVSAAAGALSVTAGGLTSSGTAGGPFTPSSVSYTLTNTGGTSINWTASKTQTWVTLSSASGTLAAGGTATVTVTINSGANSLAAGELQRHGDADEHHQRDGEHDAGGRPDGERGGTDQRVGERPVVGQRGRHRDVHGDGHVGQRYDGGDQPDVELSNSTYASISAGGVLTAATVTSNQTVTVTASYGGRTGTKSVTIVDVPAVLTSIAISSGPTSVNESSSATYTATGTWDNGTTAAIGPTWSVTPTTYASISSGGVLTTLAVTANQTATVTASYGGRTATRSVTIANVTAVLTGITVSGPSSVNEGGTGTYTATGTWDNGTTAAIGPTWSVSTSYASINAGGVLTAATVTSSQTVTVTASYGGRTGTMSVTIVDVPGPPPAVPKNIGISGPISSGPTELWRLTWDPVTTYANDAPLEPGRTVRYTAYWTDDPALSAGSLRILASSIIADMVDFDPLAYPMVKNHLIYLTAQAILDTGDQSSLAESIEWVVSNTGPAPPAAGKIIKK